MKRGIGYLALSLFFSGAAHAASESDSGVGEVDHGNQEVIRSLRAHEQGEDQGRANYKQALEERTSDVQARESVATQDDAVETRQAHSEAAELNSTLTPGDQRPVESLEIRSVESHDIRSAE